METYWQVGKEIVEEEQGGNDRAAYGKYIIREMAKRLTAEFSNGFDESNLRYIRLFYKAFPIRDALRHELTWTHFRILSRVENPLARNFSTCRRKRNWRLNWAGNWLKLAWNKHWQRKVMRGSDFLVDKRAGGGS